MEEIHYQKQQIDQIGGSADTLHNSYELVKRFVKWKKVNKLTNTVANKFKRVLDTVEKVCQVDGLVVANR